MARRSKGEGSLYFDKNVNLWRWKGSYIDAFGQKQNKYLSAKKQKDLKAKIESFWSSLNNGIQSDNDITVEQWIDIWLESFVKPSIKFSSYGIYRQKTAYAKAAFMGKKLKELTAIEVQNFLKQLTVNGGQKGQALSPSTVNSVRRYLKMCLDAAVKNKLIDNNPASGTKPQREKRKEIVVMDENQVKHFLEIAKQGDYIYQGVSNKDYLNFNRGTEYLIKCYYTLVSLGLATGMRISEMRGLSWENVFFDEKYIDINRQLIQTVDNDQFDEPKTEKSYRKIKINQKLLNLLSEFRDYQQDYAEYLGIDIFENTYNLVFTNTRGKPFALSNFRRRYFNKMLSAASIPDGFTIHSMRHTHATLLLKNGINPKVVSERLGHSNVTVTLNIYAHVLETMENTAPDMWESILDK